MIHRVAALNVKLATRGAPGDLSDRARTFAEQLVEAVAERLEERARGRLVMIRRLPVRLRARRELLFDRAELDRLADALAASINWSDASPTWSDDVIVFEDEVAWRAAFLVELTRVREVPWCFAELATSPDGCGGLATLPEPTLASVLAHVDRAGALEAVLERMGVDVLEAVVERLAIATAIDALRASHVDVARLAVPVRDVACAIREHFAQGTSVIAANADDPLVVAPATAGPEVHVTEHGGLVYLVRCLLELDAGEILWRACVSEPHVIGAALAWLADAGDPAPAQLGGASAADGFEASHDQRAEIVAALCASLHHALPRRGLTDPVDVTVRVVETERGRVLFALAGELPIFAAPVPSQVDENEVVATFRRAWPTDAAPVGQDDVVEGSAALRLRTDLSLDAALVVAVTAGCAATLFRARTGELELGARARIHDDGDARIVTMPLEAIRIAVRKAGLDRDPGWVPWIERHVRIVFEETASYRS